MKALYMLLFLLLFQALGAQEKIVEEYPDVFVKAVEEKKSVMIIFDHPNCGWCRLFDKYHALPEVKEILSKDYLIQKIDISESGEELWEYYNFRGVPGWLIFSSKRDLISDGKTVDGEQIGYPLKQTEMDAYIEIIRKSSRHISKRQLAVLRKKIVFCDANF